MQQSTHWPDLLKTGGGAELAFSPSFAVAALRIEKEGMKREAPNRLVKIDMFMHLKTRVALIRSWFHWLQARLPNRKAFVFAAVNKRSVQRALLSVCPAPAYAAPPCVFANSKNQA